MYVDRLVRDLAVALLAEHEPAVEVRGDEQRVVVEHLLEVRHEPLRVDGVAVEAAADEVVHPAGGHAVERALDQLGLAAAQQELERRGGRELRRVAEAAVARVEAGAQVRDGVVQEHARERVARGPQVARAPDRVERPTRPGAPTSSRRSRYASATAASTCRKAGRPCRGDGREVRAAEERLAARESGRPSSASRPGR